MNDGSIARRLGSGASACLRAQAMRERAAVLWTQAQSTQQAILETLRDIQATCADLRALLATTQVAPARAAPPGALAGALALAGLSEHDLLDVTDDLIAAYLRAEAEDDTRLRTAYGLALRVIGRHLAGDVGPRAAGVPVH